MDCLLSRYCLHACVPSMCGMLVYREETSKVTSNVLSGRLPNVESLLRKWVVSLMYEGSWQTNGLRMSLTYWEMSSVGWPLVDTIGLPGGCLCFCAVWGECKIVSIWCP